MAEYLVIYTTEGNRGSYGVLVNAYSKEGAVQRVIDRSQTGFPRTAHAVAEMRDDDYGQGLRYTDRSFQSVVPPERVTEFHINGNWEIDK